MNNAGDGLGLSIPGLMVILTLVGALLFQTVPLETTRPESNGLLTDTSAGADRAPARLWQDPFDAVHRYRSSVDGSDDGAATSDACVDRWQAQIAGGDPVGLTVKRCDTESERSRSDIAQQISKKLMQDKALQILAVMLPSGGFAEAAETRIRRRYAVLSALHRAGLIPVDATHIRYFHSSAVSGLPQIIPFEWMTAAEPEDAQHADAQHSKVAETLVLWLDDSVFGSHFHQRITGLVDEMLATLSTRTKVKVAVLGPATSDGLVGLLGEAKVAQGCPDPPAPVPPATGPGDPSSTDNELFIDVYPATATATDEQLFRRAGVAPAGWGDPNIKGVADYIETKLCLRLRLRVHRDTPDDGALAGALAKELDARSMHPGLVLRSAIELRSWVRAFRKTMIHLVRADADEPASKDGPGRFRHTVLISEWDTAYGRSLPLSVGRALMDSTQPCYSKNCWSKNFAKLVADGSRCQSDPRCCEDCTEPAAIRALRESHLRSPVHLWALPAANSQRQQSDGSAHSGGKTISCQAANSQIKAQGNDNACEPCCRCPPPGVHLFGYMRGLDGVLAKPAGGDQNTDPPSTDAHGDHAGAEAAQGTPQLDYLRRLAADLTKLEQGLPSHQSIGAIGVLGSDVHDKLLVIKALRPAFPSAVFFTTDLDARLYAPDQLPWTRGLLVAGGFGLQLVAREDAGAVDCQGLIPPFRSGYQSAIYYATLKALGALPRGCAKDAAEALLFEIGRQGPVALPPVPSKECDNHRRVCADTGASRARRSKGENVCDNHGRVCADTGCCNPLFKNLRSSRVDARLDALMLLALGGGLMFVFYGAHPRRLPALRAWRWPLRSRKGCGGLLLALAGLVLLSYWGDDLARLLCPLSLDGSTCVEPFSLTSGVSIWMSVYLQLLAVVLSALFVVRVLIRFNAHMRELSQHYFLDHDAADPASPCFARVLGAGLACWRVVWHRLCRLCRLGRRRDEVTTSAPSAAHPMRASWLEYRRRSNTCRRMLRVAVLSLILLTLVAALYQATGGGGNSPVRDAKLAVIYLDLRVLGVFLGGMLAFLVLDITLSSRRFIDKLSAASVGAAPLHWPSEAAASFPSDLHIDPERLSPWIALKLIAEHADLVMRLVLYPMVVLVVLVVARVPWFDTISMPPSILILYLLFAFYVFFDAFGIQRAANAARQRVCEHYRARLDVNRHALDADPRAIAELRFLIRQVSQLRDGAFQPLPARPLVRMALLPFGALGIGLLDLFG